MKWLSGILLCMLVALGACDFACFNNTVISCQKEWYGKHTSEESTFCKVNSGFTQCVEVAAKECNTGFQHYAHTAHYFITDLCTEGMPLNKALKKDPVCDIETFTNANGCPSDFDHEPLSEEFKKNFCVFQYLDQIKKCMFRKYEKCLFTTQMAFYAVYTSFYDMWQKICELKSTV